MTDAELMQQIKTQWGAAIAAACHSSIPTAGFVSTNPAPRISESFLAALVANESGGDPHAQRFEPAVFSHLAAVLVGEQAAYGSITKDKLLTFCDNEHVGPPGPFVLGVRDLRSLATSQGLVQIMGYEAIAFHLFDGVERLQQPETELPIAITMLTDFAQRFQFDVTKDFYELFDCWNTGRPHAPTADPKYIPNGLSRKQLYEALP